MAGTLLNWLTEQTSQAGGAAPSFDGTSLNNALAQVDSADNIVKQGDGTIHPVIAQATAEAGTDTNPYLWSAQRVAQAIAALATVANIPVIAKTTTYNVAAGDAGKMVDCTSGTFNVNLLAAATAGDGFALIVRNTGSGLITVTDGGSYSRLVPTGCSVFLTCDGSAYKEIAKGGYEIGDNQTWQDLTASRAVNTTYTNTTGRSIEVAIVGFSGTAVSILCGGVEVGRIDSTTNYDTVSFVVPDNTTYIWNSATGTITKWAELR